MNFKIYDIISLLIPGYLLLYIIVNSSNIPANNDSIIFSTAIAFVLGFIISTLSSWLEIFYYFTWGGKPSDKILNGKNVWKVKFYKSKEAKELLLKETSNESPSNDELFTIALSYINEKDSRVENLSAYYSFSRSLLTTMIISLIVLIATNNLNQIYFFILFPLLIIIWLRSKQRGYYYAREVLKIYLQQKNKIKPPHQLDQTS
jgi:hypothetical protein